MTADDRLDQTAPEAESRARELLRSGIAQAEAGEFDAASDTLMEARRIAMETGDHGLAVAAQINLGYARTLQGDPKAAAPLYQYAAELAREHGDEARLKVALVNLSATFTALGRNEDANSTLTEYIMLLDDDPRALVRAYLNRSASYAALDEPMLARADLEEADRFAEEAKDARLIYLVRMHQGSDYMYSGEPGEARRVLEDAVDIADVLADAEASRDSQMALGHACRVLGDSERAVQLFAAAEDAARGVDDPESLAEVLYWHGVLLDQLERSSLAVQRWDEAAGIRRSLGQLGHLADCQYAKAEVLRTGGDHAGAEPLYAAAVAVFTTLDADILATALLGWSQTLWALRRGAEAAEQADAAIRVAAAKGDATVERKAQGVKAMAAADAGDFEGAHAALDAAEALCAEDEAQSAMVWALARRAYVAAREDRDPDELVGHFRTAHEYGVDHDAVAAARSAVRKIGSYIVALCDERYHEPLAQFRSEQLAAIKALAAEVPAEEEPSKPADRPADEPGDDEVGS